MMIDARRKYSEAQARKGSKGGIQSGVSRRRAKLEREKAIMGDENKTPAKRGRKQLVTRQFLADYLKCCTMTVFRYARKMHWTEYRCGEYSPVRYDMAEVEASLEGAAERV